MANGTWNSFNSFWHKVGSGLINLASGGDAFRVALASATYTPDIDTHDFYNDLTNEASGTGYTEGGATLASQSLTQDNANNRAVWDAADPTWAAATVTFRYAVIYAHKPTNIRSTTYRWILSAGGTNEYYCELSGGGDPSLADPDIVDINGVQATEGTVGALAAGQWDYGDNDALGYSTVYVRLSDGTDPDSKASGYVKHSVKSDDPLVGYLDFAANQVYSAQNVTISFDPTGIFPIGP